MALLKKWAEAEEAKERRVAERCLELVGELTDLFNERASILEYEAKVPRVEAERIAILEVQSTPQFRQWRALEKRHGDPRRGESGSIRGIV